MRLSAGRTGSGGGRRSPGWGGGGGRGGSLPPPASLLPPDLRLGLGSPGSLGELGGGAQVNLRERGDWRLKNRATPSEQRRRGNRVKLGTAFGQFPPCSRPGEGPRRAPYSGVLVLNPTLSTFGPHTPGARRDAKLCGTNPSRPFVHSFIHSTLRACPTWSRQGA